MTAPPTLAQIVAALSVSYTDAGVLTWLYANRAGVQAGRLSELARAVRVIGDADPADFTVTEAQQRRAEPSGDEQ